MGRVTLPQRAFRSVCTGLALVGLVAMGACRGPGAPEQPVPATPAEPSGEARATAGRPNDSSSSGSLERAVGLTFGLPLPEGLELVERDEDRARYTTNHSREQLVSFYASELTEHREINRPDGTKFESDDGSQADIYVVDGETQREVFYFRAPPALPPLSAAQEGTGQSAPDRSHLAFARRFPWRQGPVAEPRVVDRLGRAEPGQGGGQHYEERFEDIDGERVRILTVRSDSESSQAAPLPQEYWQRLPQRRRGGSYDRGEGQRSLRPTPARRADGEPLPFYGTQRLDIDPYAHPH